jgi:metal-dependent amidase/aminoacylase/carboxypeptidase family protein
VASDLPCLEAWGIQVTRGVARTGVVCTLEGLIPGECSVGLRAGRPAS